MPFNPLEGELQFFTHNLAYMERYEPEKEDLIKSLKLRIAELKRELGLDPQLQHEVEDPKAEFKPVKPRGLRQPLEKVASKRR